MMRSDGSFNAQTPPGDSGVLGDSPVPLSPAELLRAWRLRRAQCKTRVQRDCCVLSPMDEMVWFDLPQQSYFAQPLTRNPGQQCAPADPQRVSILFSVEVGQTAVVGIDPSVSGIGSQGIAISPGFCLVLNQSDVGPLVQQAWYWQGSNTSTLLTVITVRLKDWPATDQ